MVELFGVATADIDNEVRTSNVRVPLASQMVNGPKMRELIARMVSLFGTAVRTGSYSAFPTLHREQLANPGKMMGYALGAIADFCFNLEYVRRINDTRWAYCTHSGDPRVYYSYLGVCPHCIQRVSKPIQAALGTGANSSDDERESRVRYFGNKIQSHHVGRIGERVLVYILDMLTRSTHPQARTLMVHDDQHDVDTVFFFDGIGVLAQIKASPLILLPVVAKLQHPLTDGRSESTGLPKPREDHTFTDFAAAEHDLSLYLSIDDSTINLGKRASGNWPYEPLLSQLTEKDVLRLIENWLQIYLAFAVPKILREGRDINLAYLTAGWGAPIDDNKTKAGLARSDNMMKGTYACLKYGAYYVQDCQRKSLKTALVANIDPAHQYADYLEKLEDIKWGHSHDFHPIPEKASPLSYEIAADKLTNLFDGVFTFNRQIMNDSVLGEAWDLAKFSERLLTGDLTTFLQDWKSVPNA